MLGLVMCGWFALFRWCLVVWVVGFVACSSFDAYAVWVWVWLWLCSLVVFCLCLGQCVIVFVVIWVAGFGVLIDLVGDVLMVGVSWLLWGLLVLFCIVCALIGLWVV